MPTINKLTDGRCKSARPADKPQKLADGHGLYLYVTTAGAKVWRMAYRVDGKPQTATFGPYPLVTLADARARRDALRLALLSGYPVKRAPRRDAITLAAACEAYWAGRKDVSDGYRMNAEHALQRHILPVLGARRVADLERADILSALSVMDAAGLHVYVRRTRMWLGQVLDWCVEHGHAQANHAASIKPEKAFGKAPVESFAALDVGEVPAFMARLELEGVIQSAIACKLLALTWVRTQELRLMEWAEIDGDLWRIPAGKMKRRRDHLVPLSRQALALVDHMRARSKGSRYVFPSDRRLDRPMSENSILYLIGRMGYGGRMTGHGWRSVASTWANEAGWNRDAIERQLAHAPDDKVRAIYNRAEFMPDRRSMLQAWADWLMPPARPAPA
jgi:integrase